MTSTSCISNTMMFTTSPATTSTKSRASSSSLLKPTTTTMNGSSTVPSRPLTQATSASKIPIISSKTSKALAWSQLKGAASRNGIATLESISSSWMVLYLMWSMRQKSLMLRDHHQKVERMLLWGPLPMVIRTQAAASGVVSIASAATAAKAKSRRARLIILIRTAPEIINLIAMQMETTAMVVSRLPMPMPLPASTTSQSEQQF